MTMQPLVITRPKVIDADIFKLHGELISRVVMNINGRRVQLVMHDGGPMIDIDIDNVIGAQVHITQLDNYISETIGDVNEVKP